MNEEYRQLMILEPGTNVRKPLSICRYLLHPVPKSTGSPCVANAWTVRALVRCVVFCYIPGDREIHPFEGVGRSAPPYALYVLSFSGKWENNARMWTGSSCGTSGALQRLFCVSRILGTAEINN